jgi:hypothetical protein
MDIQTLIITMSTLTKTIDEKLQWDLWPQIWMGKGVQGDGNTHVDGAKEALAYISNS